MYKFENKKRSYWYFRVVSFYLKKLQINTSICHCFVFYFTQISLSDRVLCPCSTTHVIALCRIYPCLFYFICYLFLHIYLNANIGSFMEEWWPHKLYFYMYLLILTRFFWGCAKSDLQIFAGSDQYVELCKLHSIYVCFFYF